MSQGNWGGGGQPPGGGGWGGQGGGGGYGPPPGGGGGYGPPGAPPGAPPGGGGYGPPGGAPPGGGGYGPPGGAPPGGGGYGPPGAPPGAPPGGGGYGPPPGGGGYGAPPGAPPGGGGYGPPPGGGGYGAPPGGGGFAPPPAGFPPAYGGGGGVGGRVKFTGEGGKLFVVYLMGCMLPLVGTYVVGGAVMGVGMLIDSALNTGVISAIFSLIGGLVIWAGLLFTTLFFMNKFFEFYYSNTTFDGQSCRYVGTLGSLAKMQFVNVLLMMITAGIYTPWAIVKLRQWQFENIEVNGQKGRLTFVGDGGSLFGQYLLGSILVSCTFGIYGPWFVNNLFAWMWENTKLDGRAFGFQKDPGGFFGTYLLTMILNNVTCGIYTPWGICNILKWETERVT